MDDKEMKNSGVVNLNDTNNQTFNDVNSSLNKQNENVTNLNNVDNHTFNDINSSLNKQNENVTNLNNVDNQIFNDINSVSNKQTGNVANLNDANKQSFNDVNSSLNKLNENVIDLNNVTNQSCNNVNSVLNNQNRNVVYNEKIFINNKTTLDKGKELLVNKKFLMVVAILVFVFVSLTVVKTFYLRGVVDNYEEVFLVIESKDSRTAIFYDEEDVVSGNLKTGAATELINCINSSVDVDDLPDSVSSIIDEINNYYNQSNDYFAFKYKDIYTGFSVSYNENQNIFTASTIKAPKDIYIYEMASMGKINLDEKLTYTSSYYNTGSGFLRNREFNTKYSIKDLSRYSIMFSDNAAHNMLMDRFGRENMLKFWKEKGTTAIFTQDSNWGVTNAHDATIYMEELYRFYIENETYGQELMNNFLRVDTKFIKGKNNYKIANKPGWTGSVVHDVAIIFAENPYIVVALSNLGATDYYEVYFNKANDFAYRLHTEYWKYKMDVCDNIGQY